MEFSRQSIKEIVVAGLVRSRQEPSNRLNDADRESASFRDTAVNMQNTHCAQIVMYEFFNEKNGIYFHWKLCCDISVNTQYHQ